MALLSVSSLLRLSFKISVISYKLIYFQHKLRFAKLALDREH